MCSQKFINFLHFYHFILFYIFIMDSFSKKIAFLRNNINCSISQLKCATTFYKIPLDITDIISINGQVEQPDFLTITKDIFDNIKNNNNPNLRLELLITLINGVCLVGERPFLNFTCEILLINRDNINIDDGIVARFSINNSFFDLPFEKNLREPTPRYFISPNMNIEVDIEYRRQRIPRLLICTLVFLLKNIFPENFDDDTYLYIDADGSDKINADMTFWDYIGMESNQENVIEPNSAGFEKRIQVKKLYNYIFSKPNANNSIPDVDVVPNNEGACAIASTCRGLRRSSRLNKGGSKSIKRTNRRTKYKTKKRKIQNKRKKSKIYR